MKNKRLLQLIMMLGLVYGFIFAENYYQEVGLNPTATPAEINSACKKEMFKYHPDKNPNNPDAKEKFQEINNACEVLRDPTKRANYDKMLEVGTSASGEATKSTETTKSTLAIEAPETPKTPQTWLESIKSKVQSLAKGKEEKISNFVGDQLVKIPIPSQATTLFNQNLSIKDLSFVKAPSSDAKAALGFTGTVQLNQFMMKGTVYAFVDKKDNKQVSVEIELPDQYSLVDMFPSFQSSVISKLKMPKGRMILTSIEYTSGDWDVKQGLNFAAILDLSGPVEVLDTLRKKAVTIPGVIAEGGQAIIGGLIPQDIQKFELKAEIPLKIGVDFTQISKVPKSVSDIFKKIQTTEFYVRALPAKVKLEAGGTMQLVLGTQPAPLDFVIQGSVEKQLVSIAGSVNGMLELQWASLGDLGLQIDIDQAILPAAALFGVPFTGIGLRGKLNLGKPGEKRANLEAAAKISFKGSEIPDLLMDVQGTNIHLDDFIVFMSEVAKKQGIVSSPIAADKMPVIKIDSIKGYFAAADVEIGSKEYKRGLSMDAKANLFDQKMDMYFFLDPNPKNIHIKGKGYLSPIDLKVIKLSGAGCASDKETREGACMEFDFQVAKPLEVGFYLDGKLEIPKIDVSVSANIKFDKSKFSTTFDSRVQDFFVAGFALSFEEKKIDEFEAEFNFKGDFGKFMNDMVLPEVRALKADAVAKAAQADEQWKAANLEWNKFNDQVKAATAELEKHRAEVTGLQNRVNDAQVFLNKLQDEAIKKKWDQIQADIEACNRANDEYKLAVRKFGALSTEAAGKFFKQSQCAKVASSGASWLASKGLQGRTQSQFNQSKMLLESYKQSTKAADAAKAAFETASRGLQAASTKVANADVLRKTTQAVTGVFEKLVEVIAAGAQIVNLTQAKGHVKGKELKEGKLPKLVILELTLQIPTQVPKIGGKSKALALKDLQFDFKNPKTSAQTIAKSLAQSIKDMVK